MHKYFFFVFFLLITTSTFARADQDGKIISSQKYQAPTYLNLGLSNMLSISPSKYSACRGWILNQQKSEFLRVEYVSDGLKIFGVVARPKVESGHPIPIVIFNRGGNGDFGKVQPCMIQYLIQPFLDEGFAVFAPQYRGADGGEGHDEFGGNDVHDVLNAIVAAKNLSWVNTKGVFMFGWSRGGMMTYLALKNHADVKAAVVVAGDTDLFITERLRPIHALLVHRKLIPNYVSSRDTELKARSALFWADEIKTPLLIFQGDQDSEVDVLHAQEIDKELSHLGKDYELVIYPGGDHHLRAFRSDLFHRTVQLFRRFMK